MLAAFLAVALLVRLPAATTSGYTITPSTPALVHLVTKPGAQAKFPAICSYVGDYLVTAFSDHAVGCLPRSWRHGLEVRLEGRRQELGGRAERARPVEPERDHARQRHLCAGLHLHAEGQTAD
jgi:hypothetical protein